MFTIEGAKTRNRLALKIGNIFACFKNKSSRLRLYGSVDSLRIAYGVEWRRTVPTQSVMCSMLAHVLTWTQFVVFSSESHFRMETKETDDVTNPYTSNVHDKTVE